MECGLVKRGTPLYKIDKDLNQKKKADFYKSPTYIQEVVTRSSWIFRADFDITICYDLGHEVKQLATLWPSSYRSQTVSSMDLKKIEQVGSHHINSKSTWLRSWEI